MPTSDRENEPWILERIISLNPATVLDVGPGMGKYGQMLKKHVPTAHVDAVEAFEPYINHYGLPSIYNSVIVKDIREHDNFNYDLIIFGDVLEHMTEADAKKVWDKARAQAKYAIISIPTVHCPQGAWGGNPYEIHHEEDWTTERVLAAFPGIIENEDFTYTGAYLAKFN